jgi:hypothetical protein
LLSHPGQDNDKGDDQRADRHQDGERRRSAGLIWHAAPWSVFSFRRHGARAISPSEPPSPRTGSDHGHVATVTADLDRIVAFYRHAFDAWVTFEMAATPAHPRMVILDIGGGSALNITEQAAGTIVGDRARPGSRGPIDH